MNGNQFFSTNSKFQNEIVVFKLKIPFHRNSIKWVLNFFLNKKTELFLFILFLNIALAKNILAQAVFPPAAGQIGSTAVYKDSSSIKSWATGIEINRGWVNMSDQNFTYNGSNKTTFGFPPLALGKATGDAFGAVSLGDAGWATLTFNQPIFNGEGADFVVFENGFSDTFLELAFVEVSSDGNRFVRFPAVSLTPTDAQINAFGTLDPTLLNNFAGKYRQGYGTPFNLDDIQDSTNIDLNNIRFVRIVDVIGSINDEFCTFDSQANKVNDPWATPFDSGGFDLEAIGVINAGENYQISTINDLNLEPNSYWCGTANSTGFKSNTVFYQNTYDSNSNSWSGFAYSNMTDNTTAGYSNQFSAYTRGGMEASDAGGTNYAVGFVPNNWLSGTYEMIPIELLLSEASIVGGFYVTNSTFAYLAMKNGDAYAKKFGGTSGNDPDYFKLLIWGEKQDGALTQVVEFYLSDFRFNDNSKDYIIDNWRWVDLMELGEVKKLFFELESTDAGAYGMNTPAYFCMDNLTINSTFHTNITLNQGFTQNVYPNPFYSTLSVEAQAGSIIQMFDVYGRKLFEKHATDNTTSFSTENLTSGYYFVKTIYKGEIKNRKVLKL